MNKGTERKKERMDECVCVCVCERERERERERKRKKSTEWKKVMNASKRASRKVILHSVG
jgi:hypothetical protein